MAADWNTRGTTDHSIFEVYAEGEQKKALTAAAKKRARADLLRRSNFYTGTLPLPPSSFDLPVQDEAVMLRIAQAYELIRRFGRVLHVKAFLLEDFARALTLHEQTPMLSAVHVALLRTVSAELEVGDTMIDSLSWGLLDSHNWPELLRKFLLRYAFEEPENDASALTTAIHLQDTEYESLPVRQKVSALELLISHVVGTEIVRGDLGGTPDFESEDLCNQCKEGGDLLCCETCPTVYHIGCTTPPLLELPEEEWYCPECESKRTPGASSAELVDDEAPGMRLYNLGSDRLFRQYYYVGRRIFVETIDNKVVYYSSKEQLDALLTVFEDSRDKEERRLRRRITSHYETIVKHMEFTTEQTKAKMEGADAMAEHAVDLAPNGKQYAIDEYAACSEDAEDAFTVWRRENKDLLSEPEYRQGVKADAESATAAAEAAAAAVAAEESMARMSMEITAELTGATIEELQAKKARLLKEKKVEVKEATNEVTIAMGEEAEQNSWGSILDPLAYPIAPGKARDLTAPRTNDARNCRVFPPFFRSLLPAMPSRVHAL